jgi:phosphoadenosine phosphosulfate reductase
MPTIKLSEMLELSRKDQDLAFTQTNAQLDNFSPQERVVWALENLEAEFVLSSSFGIQSALMLHLVTRVKADMPVVLTDTGYLFPETYQFIDHLSEQLKLNLHVYTPKHSAAWQEARHGQLWSQGVDGIEQYNRLNKVEPMQRAMNQLAAKTWFSGLRREQASSRAALPILGVQNGRFKFLPIVDWTNKDVHYYLKEFNLPYHPLWEKGYVSVGDTHTTRKLEPGMTEEETRFFGLKRECGLHEDNEYSNGDGI